MVKIHMLSKDMDSCLCRQPPVQAFPKKALDIMLHNPANRSTLHYLMPHTRRMPNNKARVVNRLDHRFILSTDTDNSPREATLLQLPTPIPLHRMLPNIIRAITGQGGLTKM